MEATSYAPYGEPPPCAEGLKFHSGCQVGLSNLKLPTAGNQCFAVHEVWECGNRTPWLDAVGKIGFDFQIQRIPCTRKPTLNKVSNPDKYLW